MQCLDCHREISPGALTCPQCGAAQTVYCVECGASNARLHRFCHACGGRLVVDATGVSPGAPRSYTPRHLATDVLNRPGAIEGERKHVTVLFVDVSGFTALSARLDPEDVHRFMARAFELMLAEVHGHEGTVNQFLGDGIMALFGAPISHEDHAQRAVHAALGIRRRLDLYQDELRRDSGITFAVRQGINTGLVVVGTIGGGLRMDYTAVGDTTNVAARLQQAARPRQIVISEATRRIVAGHFRDRPLDALALKGKTEPVKAWEVLSARDSRTRLDVSSERGLSVFVGRERDIELLEAQRRDAAAGRGRIVLISGEAGIGKSRLLREFRARVQPSTGWLEGHSSAIGAGTAFHPLVSLLKHAFDIGEEDAPSDATAKIERSVYASDADLAPAMPTIRFLLGLEPDATGLAAREPRQRRSEIFAALRLFVLRAAQPRPHVFVLDDLQWADQGTEDWLAFVADTIPASRVLMILTHRPDYTPPEKLDGVKLALMNLATEDTVEVTRSMLGAQRLEDTLRALIYGKTEGNPLFLEEIVRSLRELGLVTVTNDGTAMLTKGSGEVAVPDQIQDLLMSRIDRLDEKPKRVLQVAAAIGRDFSGGLIDRVLEVPGVAEQALRVLATTELIHPITTGPDIAYTFSHALTQEVAYSSLLLQRRRELHRRIGAALEDVPADRLPERYEILAYHFERADAPSKAVEYLAKAGEKARRAYLNQEAARFLRAAVSRLEMEPNAVPDAGTRVLMRAQLHESLGDVGHFTGSYADAVDEYEAAAAAAPEASSLLQARLRRKIASVWSTQRKYEDAVSASERAETLLGKTRDEPAWWQEWIQIHLDRMGIYYWRADADGMARIAEKARRAVSHTATAPQRAQFFVSLAMMAYRRDRYAIDDDTLANARAALTAWEASGQPSEISVGHFNLGFAHLWRNELDEAEQHLQAALALTERTGDVVHQSRCLTYLAVAARKRGRVEEVQRYVAQVLPVASAGQMLEYLGTARGNLAWIAWRKGEMAEVTFNGRAALEVWQKLSIVYAFQWTALVPLFAAALQSRAIETAVDYARALLAATQQRMPDPIGDTVADGVRSWDEGQRDTAQATLDRALEALRAHALL
jgi:class 3 adenylate cyclase/tetratricopeptide (TPR) repeat protein